MNYASAVFLYTASIKIADTLTVLAVWYGAWYLRFHTHFIPVKKGVPELSQYASASWTLAATYLAVFHMIGVYRSDRIHFGMGALRKVFQGSLLGLLAFISVSYLMKNVSYSRAFLMLLPGLIAPAILLERLVLHFIWRIVQERGIERLKTLVVGHGDLLSLFIRQISIRNPYPIDWLGRIGAPDADLDGLIPYLGSDVHLIDKIEGLNPKQVIVALPTQQAAQYDALLLKLGNYPVAVKVLPDFGKFNTFSYRAADECGIPLLQFNQLPPLTTAKTVKRILDLSLSLAGILVLSPLLGIIAAAIRLTSRGPVLYAQERIGADGTMFMCLKFRTMFVDAENQSGPVWAKKDDPRTTPLGSLLRRTSLDELPQLINVIRGEMSLVGPRPERPHFVDQFRKEVPKYLLRHRMKSGLTGWAQVNGWRGNTSIEQRIKYDLYYIGHWSVFFDLKIILLTFFKGFVNKNAY